MHHTFSKLILAPNSWSKFATVLTEKLKKEFKENRLWEQNQTFNSQLTNKWTKIKNIRVKGLMSPKVQQQNHWYF